MSRPDTMAELFLASLASPPSTPRATLRFSHFTKPRMATMGQSTRASASGAHEDTAELGLGLWLRRASGELSHIFAIGDRAPGIESEVHFVDTFNPILNASSHVAFFAVVAGDGVGAANEIGLWSNGMSSDGGLRLIARQSDEAPGNEQGFVFGTFLEPSFNAAGQTAFMAAGYRLENEVVVENAFGIWGQDRAGILRLVAQVGQNLEIGPGAEREIASLAFASNAGGEDGKAARAERSGTSRIPRRIYRWIEWHLCLRCVDGSRAPLRSAATARCNRPWTATAIEPCW